MNRRQIAQALLAITTSSFVGVCNSRASANKDALIEPNGDFLTSEEMTLLSTVADHILPRTETPGAVDAGVPGVIDALLADWADAPYREKWRTGLEDLAHQLQGDAGEQFHRISDDLRAKKLGALDANAYEAPADEVAFYPELKYTVCTAYYMSKPGATEELRYQRMPGRWAPCIPFEAGDRAWLSGTG